MLAIKNYHLNKIENFIKKKYRYSVNNVNYMILYKDLYHFRYIINKKYFKHFIHLLHSTLKRVFETHGDEDYWIFYFKIKNIFF